MNKHADGEWVVIVKALVGVAFVALAGGLVVACESPESEAGLWYHFASERQSRGLLNTGANNTLHETALQNAYGMCEGSNPDLVTSGEERSKQSKQTHVAEAEVDEAAEAEAGPGGVFWRDFAEDKYCLPNGPNFVNRAWNDIMARGIAMWPQWTDAGVAVYVCDSGQVLQGLTCVSFLYAQR